MELYRKHRPSKFSQVIGQDEAIKVLESKLKNKTLPHSILFSGPSGVGKTTLARIVAKKLGCTDVNLNEINSAESRGIDTVRDVLKNSSMSPMGGTCRVTIFDECHQSSSDSFHAMLKLLEECPAHCYYFLCTTVPEKLPETLRTRCLSIPCRSLTEKELVQVVGSTWDRTGHLPGVGPTNDVIERIAECANGSARMAVQLFDKVIELATPEEQLDAIQKSDSRRQSFDLVKLLLWKGKLKWEEIAAVIKDSDMAPESFRQLIIANLSNEILKGGKGAARAFDFMDECFKETYHHNGKAGLTASCYKAWLMSQGKL